MGYFLTVVAREAPDKARALPQFHGPPVRELSGLSDRFLIVSALYYGRGRSDVTASRDDVDAIVRHGGGAPVSVDVNRYHIPEPPYVHK
jgi:hypothetical protein